MFGMVFVRLFMEFQKNVTMKNSNTKILLCEDDANLAMIMGDYLREHNYVVTTASNGQDGLETILNQAFDLCLLDLVSPAKNGLDMLRTLRASGIEIPVIILSQYGEKEDILEAYEAGCDEYVIKPMSMDILMSKIQAWLHRCLLEEENQAVVFQLGKVTFDSVKQTLGKQHLSGRENDLLLMLCRKQNHLVERSKILQSLWQVDNYFASRSLSVYINHLRHVLEKVPEVRILAVHGKGYKLVIE